MLVGLYELNPKHERRRGLHPEAALPALMASGFRDKRHTRVAYLLGRRVLLIQQGDLLAYSIRTTS
jgi:hypothetical protein